MDIFDKIGGKISQTANVVKINGLIADEEKRINASLLEIGKVCFEKYSDNPDASLDRFVAQINDAKSKIEEYSAQIKKIKGYIKCEQCGAEIPPDNSFCNGCGFKIEVKPKNAPNQSGISCNSCGASLSPDLAFCTNCGQKKE